MERKVQAGGAAGAITVIVVWVAGLLDLDVPPEVASAFTVLVSLATGWLVPEPDGPRGPKSDDVLTVDVGS